LTHQLQTGGSGRRGVEANYEEMGFTKRTEYLKGGGTKVTYERKQEEKKEENE